MPLVSGSRLGPYQILTAIGAGGMGEVYRAKDTNLDRDVAIKVLPESFALDADRVARFAREAKILAALNHPNIAAIYGLEKAGVTALVMELVEGEDLSQRIARGALSLDDALPIGKQIADALEAAHEQGIVHRDLKPANIKVRRDGTVKVLDFGLAKAMTADGAGAAADSNLANSPTFTSPAMTAMGIIVGTAAYMAPEQARGKVVDKRADIWAFGAVVYEMLTRRQAFAGEETSDVLAAVLRQDVDWSALPPDTPARLRRLLERCLDRDVKTRLRDIGEARVEIANIEHGAIDPVGSGTTVAAPVAANTGRTRERVAWTIAALAVIALGALAFLRVPAAPAESARKVILPFVPPANVVPGDVSYVTVSPDGTKIVFSAYARDGRKLLWVRPLDSSEATPLPDTDQAIEPFWSPDSKSVAFGSRGKLRRLDLGAGRATVLGDATRLNNGAWSPAGVIVFSPDYGTALLKVPATGGAAPTPATTLDGAVGDTGHRFPAFLPDGRHFLFRSDRGGKTAILVASFDSKETKEIPVETTGAVKFVPPGFLLYIRNGTVVAHRFDPDSLKLSGEPAAIAPASTEANYAQGARLSASNTGVLVVQNPVGYDYQLAMFDRSGKPAGTLGSLRTRVTVNELPRISPDGTRVAVQRFDPREQNQDLWIGDLARGSFDRFTTNPAQEQMPLWTPDARTLLTTTWRNPNANGVYALPITGGEDHLLLKGTVFPSDVSSDGKWLVFLERGDATRSDIGVLPLSGARAAGAPRTIVNSAANEMAATLSPDGKWLAYVSDLTGADEIYVRSFAADGTVGVAIRVTNGGGDQPAWSRDGRELYYVDAPADYVNARMMAVPVVTTGGEVKFGAASVRFKASLFPTRTNVVRDYDVGPDGRFVIGTATVDSRVPPANVVLNWKQ